MSRSLCTFQLGGLQLGCAVASVLEVVPAIALTPVPLAPESVEGLVNLRGRVVPVVQLCAGEGSRQGYRPPVEPAGQEDRRPGTEGGEAGRFLLVLQAGGEVAALRIDGVASLEEVNEAEASPPPATLPDWLRGLARCVHCCVHSRVDTPGISSGLLLELDPEAIIRTLIKTKD